MLFPKLTTVLGALDTDMEELASSALEHLDLDIAKRAYARLEDYNSLELIQELQVYFFLLYKIFKLRTVSTLPHTLSLTIMLINTFFNCF